MSLSVKAGAMLLLPTFLGWVHFFYGTKKLAICFGLIVVFQVALMCPICFDPIAKMVGF